MLDGEKRSPKLDELILFRYKDERNRRNPWQVGRLVNEAFSEDSEPELYLEIDDAGNFVSYCPEKIEYVLLPEGDRT